MFGINVNNKMATLIHKCNKKGDVSTKKKKKIEAAFISRLNMSY